MRNCTLPGSQHRRLLSLCPQITLSADATATAGPPRNAASSAPTYFLAFSSHCPPHTLLSFLRLGIVHPLLIEGVDRSLEVSFVRTVSSLPCLYLEQTPPHLSQKVSQTSIYNPIQIRSPNSFNSIQSTSDLDSRFRPSLMLLRYSKSSSASRTPSVPAAQNSGETAAIARCLGVTTHSTL